MNIQTPQPWSPSREDQMRLNALQLAVATQGDPNKIKLASEYFAFLNEPYAAQVPADASVEPEHGLPKGVAKGKRR